MPMQYKEIFKVVKNENFPSENFDIFLIFAQNTEAVLTSTHNLCFEPAQEKRFSRTILTSIHNWFAWVVIFLKHILSVMPPMTCWVKRLKVP